MIITFLGVNKSDIEFFSDKFSNAVVNFYKENISEVYLEKIKLSDVLCVNAFSKLTSNILENFPNLKLVATRSTGFEHIDTNYCRDKNIAIKSVPLYGERTIAEYTFALLLCLSRKILEGATRIKNNSFSKAGLMGFDLENKIIGIIGGGNIGLNVAKIAKGFEMKVLVYDINENLELAQKIGFEYSTLDNLLKSSDIISVNVPYNKYTHHLINKDAFEKMKDGAIFINTARGAIVDTPALIEALESQKILAAGLDVFEGEEVFAGHVTTLSEEEKQAMLQNIDKLLSFSNVIVTPHNAYNTLEATNRINKVTLENIENVL